MAHYQQYQLTQFQQPRLPHTQLQQTQLPHTQLQQTQLPHTQLQQIQLPHAQLQQIQLPHAQLQQTHLPHTQLQQTQLPHTQLQQTHLPHAQLQQLPHAQLQQTQLPHAQLQQTQLPHTQLQQTQLPHAQLQRTQLPHAQLQQTQLPHTQLQQTQLPHAQLQQTQLPHTQLQQLPHAQLQQTQLPHAQLQQTQLPHAQLQQTQLPQAQLQINQLPHPPFQPAQHQHNHLQHTLRPLFPPSSRPPPSPRPPPPFHLPPPLPPNRPPLPDRPSLPNRPPLPAQVLPLRPRSSQPPPLPPHPSHPPPPHPSHPPPPHPSHPPPPHPSHPPPPHPPRPPPHSQPPPPPLPPPHPSPPPPPPLPSRAPHPPPPSPPSHRHPSPPHHLHTRPSHPPHFTNSPPTPHTSRQFPPQTLPFPQPANVRSSLPPPSLPPHPLPPHSLPPPSLPPHSLPPRSLPHSSIPSHHPSPPRPPSYQPPHNAAKDNLNQLHLTAAPRAPSPHNEPIPLFPPQDQERPPRHLCGPRHGNESHDNHWQVPPHPNDQSWQEPPQSYRNQSEWSSNHDDPINAPQGHSFTPQAEVNFPRGASSNFRQMPPHPREESPHRFWPPSPPSRHSPGLRDDREIDFPENIPPSNRPLPEEFDHDPRGPFVSDRRSDMHRPPDFYRPHPHFCPPREEYEDRHEPQERNFRFVGSPREAFRPSPPPPHVRGHRNKIFPLDDDFHFERPSRNELSPKLDPRDRQWNSSPVPGRDSPPQNFWAPSNGEFSPRSQWFGERDDFREGDRFSHCPPRRGVPHRVPETQRRRTLLPTPECFPAPPFEGPPDENFETSGGPPPPPLFSRPEIKVVSADKIFDLPGRAERPSHIVVILRGLPGSGKSHIAKLIREKELSHNAPTPRLLSLDSYFLTDIEKTKKDPDTGRLVKRKVHEYEFEAEMEQAYRSSLFKAYNKTLDEGFFPVIVVDANNHKVHHFDNYWSNGKVKGFEVYIVELLESIDVCVGRNTHRRTREEIEKLAHEWEETPPHFTRLDVTALLSDSNIDEVEMECTGSDNEKEEKAANSGQAESQDAVEKSRWEDVSDERLDKLDDVGMYRRRKRLRSEAEEEEEEEELGLLEYLRMREKNLDRKKKRVRWADLEAEKEEQRRRDRGFCIGGSWGQLTEEEAQALLLGGKTVTEQEGNS